MPRIDTDLGLAIGYDEAGSGNAIPIVFLHGVGSDKSVWRPQLSHFEGERRAIAFDYPGYGESDAATEETTRDDFAASILSAMRSLGVERAHICGLSLGGVVAIAMHAAAPEACASLILADTFAVHPDGQAIYDRSIAGSTDLPAMAEARVDVLLAQPSDPAVRSEVVETMSRIDPAAYRTGAAAVWLASQEDRAREIRVPTLVIVGNEDVVTSPVLSVALAGLISGAQLALVEGAGHLANLEKPELFNRALDEFIAGVE